MNSETQILAAAAASDDALAGTGKPDPAYEEIARLATLICEAPMALITLAQEGRISLKAWLASSPRMSRPTAPFVM